jgi:hypothetical protein
MAELSINKNAAWRSDTWQSSSVKGNAPSNVLSKACSSMVLLIDVASIIIDKPIKPTQVSEKKVLSKKCAT